MQQDEVLAALAGLPLGGLHFFPSIGSTNDEALAWANAGAPDLSLVLADEQTAGRGRAARRWFTPPGAALALSVVLRPTDREAALPAHLTGLAALALVDCCRDVGLAAQVKWPNDVLLNGRKVAGILAESAWDGNSLAAAVLGIGVNVAPASVPPAEQLSFPSTSLEAELGRAANRLGLLRAVLEGLLRWRPMLGSDSFIEAWDAALAFRRQAVVVSQDGAEPIIGTLSGLDADGSLRLQPPHDKPVAVHFGEIHLRPMDDRMG